MAAKGLAEFLLVAKELKKEFPGFEIKLKSESTLMKVINVLLFIITLGQMRKFMTGLVTQLGNNIYVPTNWDSRPALVRAITLRHERVHMRQRQRYGSLGFTIRYLCWPLPAIFALGRRDLEQEAYAESMQARAQYFGVESLDEAYKDHLVKHFTSATYFWTYPFYREIERWFYRTKASIMAKEKEAARKAKKGPPPLRQG